MTNSAVPIAKALMVNARMGIGKPRDGVLASGSWPTGVAS